MCCNAAEIDLLARQAFTSGVSQEHPFNFARRVSTLDHLTKGRVAWNIVTFYLDSTGRNFGFDEIPSHEERYARPRGYLIPSPRNPISINVRHSADAEGSGGHREMPFLAEIVVELPVLLPRFGLGGAQDKPQSLEDAQVVRLPAVLHRSCAQIRHQYLRDRRIGSRDEYSLGMLSAANLARSTTLPA